MVKRKSKCNLCISILEFKFCRLISASIKFFYLCISILEFKF